VHFPEQGMSGRSASLRRNLKISFPAIKINSSRKASKRRGMGKKKDVMSENQVPRTDEGFFAKNGPFLVLGVLILYVILLAIGTVAEIFKIQPILDWWIWRAP
jgi:hypothetical protein